MAAPLIEQVSILLDKARAARGDSDSYDALRRRLMTVWEMLDSIDELRIYTVQAAVLRAAAEHVRAQAQRNAAGWPDEEEFVLNATTEAAQVEQWLDDLFPGLAPDVLSRR